MELSKAQKEIVDSTSKKIIVDAGSGSGKTRVLTERVRKILNSRTDPRSVVVITFTNMAANELKERLSEVKGSEKCFIGTIHSYANSLLKDSGLDYEIFSEEYQTMFMKQLIEKYGYYSTFSDYELFLKCDKQVAAGRMSKNEVRQKFSDYKVYDEILALLGRSDNKSVKETVVTLCKENNIITFDELIELATDYFKRSKIKLEYLFVDELQDIGYLEYNFLLGLNAENYFVIGDDYQCQPSGTSVMLGDGSCKPIEDVVVGDRVVSYSTSEGYYFRDTSKSRGKQVVSVQKSYSNRIIDIVLEDNSRTSYTPNHRCFAKINYTDKTKNMSVVYIMRDRFDRFRVGSTKLFVAGGRNFGVRNRMNTEHAVDAWILGVYSTQNEAWVAEQICSYKFGIPQLTWVHENTRFSKDDISYVYESLGDLRQNVDACLKYFGRDINYPIFTKDKNIHFSKLHVTEVRACNLIPEVMDMAVVDTSESRYKHRFSKIVSLSIRDGLFDVYCIEVEKTGTYVADGILTHNSIFSFKGGDVNIFLSLMHSDDWQSYFLSENYRTAKSILLYANAIISKADNIIKKDVVCKNESLGSLEFNAKSLVDKFLGDLKEDDDWFILTRSNKEMNIIDSMLTKAGKEHYCFKQSTTSQKKVKEILSKPCIKVMTIHASKGMECENVALYGKLPVKGTGDSEELKVYYVGITRSKNRCVIFV